MNDISKHPNIGVHIMELQPPYCKRLRSWSGNSEHPAENLMAAFGEPRFQLEQNGVPFFATDQVEGADSQKGMPFQCDVIMISWHTSFNPKLTYNPTIQQSKSSSMIQRINCHKPHGNSTRFASFSKDQPSQVTAAPAMERVCWESAGLASSHGSHGH